jgi:hypothetical protein
MWSNRRRNSGSEERAILNQATQCGFDWQKNSQLIKTHLLKIQTGAAKASDLSLSPFTRYKPTNSYQTNVPKQTLTDLTKEEDSLD